MTTHTTTTFNAEITNQCTCVSYNDDAGEWETAPECWGDCWQDAFEDWHELTKEFVGYGGEFLITGFPLWNRSVDGSFEINNAGSETRQFLEAVTVRSDWRLRFTVGPDKFTGTIWHHDVPMGGTFTVTHKDDEDEDEDDE